MAYSTLATGKAWGGNNPTITVNFYADRKRSGADMQYRIKIEVPVLSGSSYFGYPIWADLILNNTKVQTKAAIKGIDPYRWESTIVWESGWFTVTGVASGTVPLTINIYSSDGSTRTGTYTFSLPVDPAAISISANSGTLGSSHTIAVNRSNVPSEWRQSVSAKIGDTTQTIASKSNATSLTWVPKLDFASAAPNGTKVRVEITCTTYKDAYASTPLGSYSITVEFTIPASVIPTASYSMSDPSGAKDKLGLWLQGTSLLKLDITSNGAYGSKITEIRTTLSNVEAVGYGSSITMQLYTAGEANLKIVVTDSRGRTRTLESTITVTAYQEPQIRNVRASRCNSDGTANPTGNRVKAEFSATLTQLTGNTAKYTLQYKRPQDDFWTSSELTNLADNFSVSGATALIPIDIGESEVYDVRIAAEDAVRSATSPAYRSPAASAFIHASAGFEFLSIGEILNELAVESQKLFNVAFGSLFKGRFRVENTSGIEVKRPNASGNLRLYVDESGHECIDTTGSPYLNNRPMVDFVVEEMHSNTYTAESGWWARKWKSGRAEFHGRFTKSIAVSTSYGSMYQGEMGTMAYPTGLFSRPPIVTAGLSWGGPALIMMGSEATQAQSPGIYIVSATRKTGSNKHTAEISAFGWWNF